MNDIPLAMLESGEWAEVTDVSGNPNIVSRLSELGVMGEDATAQRLMEMGVIEGEPFELVASAPMGDPLEIKVQGYRLSIRKSEAARVFVQVS